MTKAYERLLKCYQCFKDKINFKPEVALVLGSGFGDYADTIRVEAVLDYHDIEGFPVSTVSGHKGRFHNAFFNTLAFQGILGFVLCRICYIRPSC